MEFSQFLSELWIARWPILNGTVNTLLISAIAIFLGTLLGILVGLALTYAPRFVRFIVRIDTDFLRGTPVFV